MPVRRHTYYIKFSKLLEFKMNIPEIPADLLSPFQQRNGQASTSIFPRLPNLAKSRDPHIKGTLELPRDLNNIEEWDALIRKAEDKWESFDGPEDQKVGLASSALNLHGLLLSRFPFLTEYWRRFLVFAYKAKGIKDSLAVLELALKEYSQSVSLWVEYLTALTSAGDEVFDSDHVDKEFSRGKEQIGHNFNSDPFWDMYISHASKKDDPKDLLEVYLSLIRIPLYQYARYFNQFMELNKTFDVTEVVPENYLSEYLIRLNKSSASELSALEKQQVIDEYSNSIFVETQRQVNDMWAFESALGLQEYMPSEQPNSVPWLSYLKHELLLLNDNDDESKRHLQISIITSIFERSLVPNCFESEIWIQYTTFAESNLKFEEAKAVYDRAVFHFVPLDQPKVRENYKDYLLKHERFDLCNEYLFDLISLYVGSSGTSTYKKGPYIHSLRQLMGFWKEKASPGETSRILESIIMGFFDRVDRYKKETVPAKEATAAEQQFEIRPAFVNLLSKLLNDDGISVVVVSYLQILQSAKEVIKIRKFYNKYCREQVFSWSVQFWKFFVEFEGYDQVNLINLRSVLNYIRESTALPQRAIEAFLEIYHEIILKNLRTAMILKGPNGEDLHDTLVYYDSDKSHGLTKNSSAFKRMAHNNAHIKDKKEQEPSRNNSNHYSSSQFNVMKEFEKYVKSHSFNPGIFQYIPEGFNPDAFKYVSLLDDDAEVKPPPQHDDLEKAFAPIHYPDE